MFRALVGLILLSSCSFGVVKTGGERSYVYDVLSDYTTEDLAKMAPQTVVTSHRAPPKGQLEKLFSKEMPALKRVGILVFESQIQPTRSGLSAHNKIYLSEQGKQLLTEKLLSVWEQSFPILGPEVVYVPTSKIKKAKALSQYGATVTDYVQAKRDALAPDDIFFLPPGKNTTTATILNPRGMRDLSLALVPAAELMLGPKFSEHMKHAVNEVAKELKLDAVLVMMNEISWTASHIDKHSGEIIPEEVKIKILSSTLIPLSQYHTRLAMLGEKRDMPSTTVAFRTYEAELKIPVLLSVSPEEQTFQHIEEELLAPALKGYKDLSQMVLMRTVEDIKSTQH